MPRFPSRLVVPAALIALVLLGPAPATASPQGKIVLSAAAHPATNPGFFSKVRDLLLVLWPDTGSILDPDGSKTAKTDENAGPGTEQSRASSGDTGSGLEPNG